MDEDYVMMGNGVEDGIRNKIINNEYVDFSRLIVKNRIAADDDKRMEIINRNGQTFWQPIQDRDGGGSTINSFHKWEQAFRVFSRIYTEHYPVKAPELIQYNYIIHSASLSFTWDNVYAYDCDFRMHISRHPSRSWSVILQQAWTMRLCDRNGSGISSVGNGGSRSHNRNVCYKYNRGRCNFGFNCKFDHKCVICSKFGHGAYNCHKAGAGTTVYKDRETGEYRQYDNRDNRYDRSERHDYYADRQKNENNGKGHYKKKNGNANPR